VPTEETFLNGVHRLRQREMFAVQNPVKFFNAVKMNGKKFYSDEMREDEGGFARLWRGDENFRWTPPLRWSPSLLTFLPEAGYVVFDG
jgi:hypothetical protein